MVDDLKTISYNLKMNINLTYNLVKNLFSLPLALKKLWLAAGKGRYQITEVQITRIQFEIILVPKRNKHNFYS